MPAFALVHMYSKSGAASDWKRCDWLTWHFPVALWPDATSVPTSWRKLGVVPARPGSNIAFEQAHVEALPYPDQSFDIVWSERLLIYVPDLRQAASEMRRVLRAGGRLASIEPDISTSTLNLKDRALVRRVMGHEADTDVVHGWLPGQLRGTLTDVGSKISVLRPVWLCSHLDWQRATSRAAVILPQRTGLFPILSCTTGARELRHLLAKTSFLQPWGTSCLPPERRGTQHVV